MRHRFQWRNLFGDPFGSSTILIAVLSWIICLIGSIAIASDDNGYPRFAWWGITFQFIMIIAILLFYMFDLIDYYKLFILGGSAVCLVYNSNTATNLVYGEGPRRAAASAGVILLCIINFIWLFYFGGDNASPVNRWIDSFSLNGIKPSAMEHSKIRALRRKTNMLRHNSRAINSNNSNNYNNDNNNNGNLTSLNNDELNMGQIQLNDHTMPASNYMASNALNGFENTHYNYSPNLSNVNGTGNHGTLSQMNNLTNLTNNNDTFLTDNNGNTMISGTLGLYSEMGDDDDNFMYTAKAIYSYDADENDQYEISFDQGEILRVTDIEGRWWKAKRSNGEIGIIPSNYVELIDNN